MTKVVQVSWVDSRINDLWQVDNEDVPEPCSITSVGWLVKKDKQVVVLAREQIDDDWRGVITIPMCCVVAITSLSQPPKAHEGNPEL